jgi:vacuolar-type H+-ATPase subunit I/STV1
MKLSIIAILFLFLQTTTLQATELDIDAQIANIEQAPIEKRLQLIDALKRKIAQINEERQTNAILGYKQKKQTIKAKALTAMKTDEKQTERVILKSKKNLYQK